MVARHADSVFYNGRVYTLENENRVCEAVAVENGVVVAVGTDSEVLDSAPRGCDKYDLGGKTLIPGFIDSHTHFIQMGVDDLCVDLSDTKTLEEALEKMRAGAAKVPKGEWVIGTCWRESSWKQGRFITRADLDSCCPEHPAVAHRICGHLSSVNSIALDVLGIGAKTPDVAVDASGKPTGVLTESAVGIVREATAPDMARMSKGLVVATRKAHTLGVTSVHDNGCPEHLPVFQAAEQAGKLWVRVRFNVPSDSLDSMLKLRLSSNLGSEWLRIGGVKMFCDGALGARTAALSEPFTDDPDNKGMLVHDRAQLRAMMKDAHAAGIQIVVHAIGDRGIEVALSSIEEALSSVPRKNHRHRIEHLELPTRGHLTRMRRSSVIASMQPNFVGEWGGINGMYVDRLGHDRARRNNPFKEVLSSRIVLAFGSDCMPFSPIYGIHSAVNAPHDSQRLTPLEALAAYTRDAAFAGFEEDVKGSISVGKMADFAVLSSDPLDRPDKIGSVKVVKTVIGGVVVYDRAVAKRSGGG